MSFLKNISLITLCIIGFSVVVQAQFRDIKKSNNASKLESKFGSDGKIDWSRVYVGGQFGGSITGNGSFGVVSPEVGYYIKENFLVAAGPTFEFSFFENNRQSLMGGHAFARYNVFKGLFLHTEFESVVYKQNGSRLIYNPVTGMDERLSPITGLYAGAGLRIASFVSAMVLYNFLEDETDPVQRYTNPFGLSWNNPVIRISFGGNIGNIF